VKMKHCVSVPFLTFLLIATDPGGAFAQDWNNNGTPNETEMSALAATQAIDEPAWSDGPGSEEATDDDARPQMLQPTTAQNRARSHSRYDKDWFRAIQPGPRHPRRILVRYHEEVDQLRRQNVQARAGVVRTLASFSIVDNLHVVEVPEGRVEAVIHNLLDEPDVMYTEPDYELRFLETPNDPLFGDQWALLNDGQTVNGDPGTPGADIRAPEAWDISTGSPSTLIASLDSGIDYTHPDLAANIWTNPDEIAGNGIDDDGNGYIDDIHGWDFWDDDNDPIDESGHGTTTCGAMAGVGDNGIGIVGVSWQCQVLAFRGLTVADGVFSMEYCLDKGVRISNNPYKNGYSQSQYDAIQALGAIGHVFVTSAGNDSSDNDANFVSPANYLLPNIISVAATDNDDALAGFSNYGLTTVDLGAPGDNILTTILGGGYGYSGGTSLAAPMVAGACAVIRSVYPELNALQVKGCILSTARPVPALEGKCVSGGVLNLHEALTRDCDGDTVPDLEEIASGTAMDCNNNGIPDGCEELDDCNGDGILDVCELGGLTGIYRNWEGSTYTRVDPAVDFDWGTGSPMPGLIDDDEFRVRWSGTVVPEFTETYTFYTFTDDGVRLFVNGELVIDKLTPQPAFEWTADVDLTAGVPCEVVMDYFENFGEALAQLRWSSPSTPKQIIQFSNDCNNNGIVDSCDAIGNDCNANGIPDECEPLNNDCNANGIPDECELLNNDCNANGIPDECDLVGSAHFEYLPPADSSFVLNGDAADHGDFIRLCDVTDQTGSAVFPEQTSIPIDEFAALIDVRFDNFGFGGGESFGLSLMDASVHSSDVLFDGSGPANNCLTVTVNLGGTDGMFAELRYNGQILASAPLSPGTSFTTGRFAIRFKDGQLTLRIRDLDPCCQNFFEGVPFENVPVPDFEPVRARFGLGASNVGPWDTTFNVLSVEIDAAGGAQDCDGNGIPDECQLDCNGNGIADACDLLDLTDYTATFGIGEDSAYSLNGNDAALFDLAVRLTSVQFFSQVASLVFQDATADAVEAFTASFDIRIGDEEGLGDEGMSFAMLDAAVHAPDVLFGRVAPSEALSVEFDTSGATGNHIRLRYNGVEVAPYSPTFALDNNQWHHVDVSFDNGAITVEITPSGGATEAAFKSVVVPGYVPVQSRFGFGASTFNLVDAHWVDSISIDVVLPPPSADINENGIPDECENLGDCDANGIPDTLELAASSGYFVEFNPDGDSPVTLNGIAEVIGSELRLTPAENSQVGSLVTEPTAGFVDAFEARFSMRIGGGNGADGLSFTMMDAGEFDDTALFGEEGPGASALTLKFDTHQNTGEPNNNFVALIYNGETVATYTPTFTLNDGVDRDVFVRLAGGSIIAVIDGEIAFSAEPVPGYTPSIARFGFGAATGGLNNEHWIDHVGINAHHTSHLDCNFNGELDLCETDCNGNGVADECELLDHAQFATDFGGGGVPFQVNNAAQVLFGAARLTPAETFRLGTLVLEPITPGPVNGFTASFAFGIAGGNGADGFSFAMMDATQWGAECVFGEQGPRQDALVVEFDTFDNGVIDPNDNHLSLFYNGSTIVGGLSPSFTLDNSAWHQAEVTLADGALTVVLTPSGGSPETVFDAVPIPDYTPIHGRFGFGARTGGLTNEHWIDDLDIETDLVVQAQDKNGNGVLDECEGDFDCATCPGDLSGTPGDGLVNAADIQAFVDCALAGPGLAPGCDCADMNGDSAIDPTDTGMFLDRLLNTPSPACP